MGFIFFLIIAGFAIYLWTKNTKASQLQWQEAASRLNLAYYAGGLGSLGTISGTQYGHRITISTFSKSSGNSSQVYTKFQIEYRQRVPVDMKITRQGALRSLGKVFGLQDIEVGNQAFDDHVLLKGSDPAAVRAFLSPRLQDLIRLLVMAYDDVTITNGHVCVNKRGRAADSAIIVSTTKRLLKFCDEMNAPSTGAKPPKHVRTEETHPSAEPVLEVEEPVEIPAIEPSFDPYTTPVPVVPDPPGIPVEEAVTAVGAVEPEMPETKEPEIPEEAEPAVPEAVNPSVPVDLQQVAQELFGGSSGSSLAANKLFDEQFKGRPVTGAGIVRRANKFSYDPVFTNTDGVKAVLAVCEMAGPYSKIKVTAEVMFPAEQLDALKARIDTSLPITGKLIAHDAMMHVLYVAPM